MVSDIGVAVEEARELVRLEVAGSHAATTTLFAQETADNRVEESGEHVVELSATAEPRTPDAASAVPEGTRHVAGGIFQFGAGKEPRYLDDFFVDHYPVTNAEYAMFVAEVGHRPPRFWSGCLPPAGKSDHPVVGVSLADATAYAQWVGARIPSEEEWEKAARGSDGRAFPWGDFFCADRSNVAGAGIKDTSPVARFRQGASPCGCLDMAGNVWEWTTSPFRRGGRKCALKGGSWYDFSAYARCDGRFSAAPDYEGNSVGFRCVSEPGTLRRRISRSAVLPRDYDEDVLAGCRARDAALRPRTPSLAPREHEAPSGPGPLLDLVENTMGALSAFDVSKARACVDAVFGDCASERADPVAIEPPDPTPEWSISLPDNRWMRWLRPGLVGLARLVPWCYRGARGMDRLFRLAPRWASLALIMVIPVATLGLVWSGGVPSGSAEEAERTPARVDPGTARRSAGSVRASAPAAVRGARPGGDRGDLSGRSPARPAPPVAIGVEGRAAGRAPAAAPMPPPGMVLVAAGAFAFGRDRSPRELGAFFIDRTEVTNQEYRKFVIAAGYPPPSHWAAGEFPPGTGFHPVTNVDHADARAFAAWAGKRLPTEEEWEKAARGPEGLRYPWGNSADPLRANLFRPTAQFLGTRPVGTFPAGASPCGCEDMAGNVLEWTTTQCRGTFVLKGGSWGLSRDGGAADFRYVHFPPETRTPMVGLRCVKDVEEAGQR